MRGSGTLRKLKKKGQEGYGKLAYKINEDKEPISSITRSRVSFYYELDNGLLGRTNQSINKKTRKALEEHKNGIVPIKKLGNQAVLDLDKLGTPVIDQKLEFSSQDPTHKYKYGEVTKKSIVLLILSVLIYIGGGVAWDIIMANQSIPPQMKLTIIIPVQNLCFFLAILFYIIGASKLSYFGLAQKIRSDGEREDKQIGRLIKIVSKKNGNATFALPKKAVFQYVADNGLLIQTTQVINKKVYNKIMDNAKEEIPIRELNNYAVIDNKALLETKETKLDKFLFIIKKYRIAFIFAVLSNIYFLTTEVIHLVSSGFKDAISLFAVMMYSLTLIYISIMELLDAKGARGNWAYLVTTIFLSGSIVSTIATISISFATEGLEFVHVNLINFYGAGYIYVIYIFYKLTKSIVDARKAKRLDLDYERSQGFGDIVANIYVVLNYFAWIILSFERNTTANEVSYQILNKLLFGVIVAANIIASAIFLGKCIKGLTKANRMQIDTDTD